MRKSLLVLFCRYGVAIAGVALATSVRLLLGPLLGNTRPFITYFFTVIVIAWACGFGPAILAIILSAILAHHLFLLPTRNHQVTLVLFVLLGLVTSFLTEQIRKARQRAERKQLELAREVEERTKAERRLHDETRVTETLNRIGGRLAAELDLHKLVQVVTDEGARITHAAFGAFFFNLKDPQGESYTLYTLSGGARDAFAHLPMPRNTAVFEPTFRGQGTVRLDDVTQAPGYGQNAPHHGMPEGHLPVRSYLAVPVVSRAGEVLGGLFFGHPQVGVFSERDAHLVEGIAAQAAVAIDNARLYQEARTAGEQLRRKNEELAVAARHKDEFLAMLAHELRNPLAPLRNALHLLALADGNTAVVRQATEIMGRQVNNLARLVDDLLDVSRITRGKVELRRERIDLADVVRRAAETAQPVIDEHRHALRVSLPAQTVYLEGDPVRLEQVIANLLTNAAKYTDKAGRISLSAERVGHEAVLRVRDNGIGISPELLPRLFDLFSQAERSLDRAQGGLGIGLTLVRRLVEMHGGTVTAHSDGPGQGSEFVVRLPVAPPPPNERGDAAVKRAPQRSPSRRVLVVDDNPDGAESLALLLRRDGHEVQTACDGPTALHAVELFRPDIVLLDIGLPRMDGYEVARRLRQDRPGDGLVLAALTGYGQEEDRRRSREAGFDHHLVKPADLETVQRLLRELRPAAR